MKGIDFGHLKIKKPRKKVQDRQTPLFSFQLNWEYVKNNKCPHCERALYWNLKRTTIRCKSKLHTFVLPRKSYEDIVSGKRLEEWKKQDALNRR